MYSEETTYRIRIIGLVQGVGFRPFIVLLAKQFKLFGTVDNRNDGVIININCSSDISKEFVKQIQKQAPRASVIENIEIKEVPFMGFSDFTIVHSTNNAIKDEITEVSPDIAVCENCLQDIKAQPKRINYPLTNCTHCGPRFTIIKDLPYDRPFTTMLDFTLCKSCLVEYTNVLDRRFHAQPIACVDCGPSYTFKSIDGKIESIELILENTARLLENGETIALKGIGGFNLICNANSQEAVTKLRNSKHRDGKPIAVMFRNMETLEKYAFANNAEKEALESWRKPIVLLKAINKLPQSISVGFNSIGAVLPYMPFHYLLFEYCKLDSLVLTSANLSGEPIIISNESAAEAFLPKIAAIVSYNRDIHNRVDDSVAMVINNKLRLIRRSRGFVPSPIRLGMQVDGILAVGAELVNTFCIGRTNQGIVSQHIGDLKNAETLEFFEESINRFKHLYKFEPKYIACDLHPDYLSSQYALRQDIQVIRVQHHHAHMASCMMENQLDERVIGIIMDGTGLGTDGEIWGGEFLIGDLSSFDRFAHFKYIPLPGGDKVTKEPWRTAVSYLYSAYGKEFAELNIPFVKNLDKTKTSFILEMIHKNINSPLSSSAGRLFDAVSAILNVCTESSFHAEAPMRLEDIIEDENNSEFYPYEISNGIIDFNQMIKALVDDIICQLPISLISTKFHNTVMQIIIEVCNQMRAKYKINKVVLSGGSFQNVYLSKKLEDKLSAIDFEVFVQSKIPANDGGLSLGQLGIAAKVLEEKRRKGE